MHTHTLTQQFGGHFRHPFEVPHDCPPPVEYFPFDVEELSPDVRQLWSFRSLSDGVEKMVDLVLIHRIEVTVVCCSENWFRYVSPDYLGDPFQYSLLDVDCRKAEDVVSIGLTLGVTVVVDLGLDVDVVGAGAFGGCSPRRDNFSLLDMHG